MSIRVKKINKAIQSQFPKILVTNEDYCGVVLEQVKQTPTQAGSIAEVLLAQIDEEQIQRIPEDIATSSPVARTQNDARNIHNTSESIKLVPNPARAYVDVIIESESGFGEVQLMELVSGKVISSQFFNSENRIVRFKTEMFPSGVYLIKYEHLREQLVIIK